MGEKKHPPSEQKIKKSAEKGKIARSEQLHTFFKIAALFATIVITFRFAFLKIKSLLNYFIYSNFAKLENITYQSFQAVLLMSLTVLGVASVVGIATGLGEQKGQIIVNKNAFKPQLSLKNGFDKIVRSVKEGWLLFLKAGILTLGLVGYFYLLLKKGLSILSFEALISTKFFLLSFFVLFFAYFVCAALDFVFQKRRHYLDLRMDDQEVRDEYKELEGDPFVKNAMQERQFELLADAIENAVKNATVVITAKKS